MNQIIGQIIVAFGASTVTIGILAWLAKSFIIHLLNKDLDNHKIALEAENQKAFTLQRAELNRLSEEHRVIFSQLHTKVFVTIARLYRLLVHSHRSLINYIREVGFVGESPEEERGKIAFEAQRNLSVFFDDHEIYFDDEIAINIRSYLKESCQVWVKFKNRNHKSTDDNDEWTNVINKMSDNVNPIKLQLKDSFRKKIGVTK